jgi:4-amino-4-deoxy-L-arabinose transferase-like glycosyltransferase
MTTNRIARSEEITLIWLAVSRAGRLMTFGTIGWLWFMSASDSAWRGVSFIAVPVVATLVAIPWYLARARANRERRAALDVRADRRWRAALDRYAEQEQAKRTNSRRNVHAGPQSQDR